MKTPEPPTAAVKPPDAAQDPPRPSRAPDTSVPPQPEFPPPPPLEKDEAPGEPALPPPPGFLQEDRIKPPTSILPCIQDEDEKGEEADDLPSPEYVRQSVSKRIMAFERHSSRDEESPPRERPPASGPVRPVAPWVKRTSAGPVQQAGYWDMTSPEDQPEDAWPDPPRPPHEPEATKAQAKPVTSTKVQKVSRGAVDREDPARSLRLCVCSASMPHLKSRSCDSSNMQLSCYFCMDGLAALS